MNTTITEVTAEQENERIAAELAADLRELADIVERCPEYGAKGAYGDPPCIDVYGWAIDAKTLAALRRGIGGRFEKRDSGDLLLLTRRLGNGRITVTLGAVRSAVCERVVIETVVIPETIVPETIVPARVQEIVEWRCGSILGAEGGES